MKKTIQRLALMLSLALSALGTAQAADLSDAEVRKVDREAGKVTLRHGEIKNLDMPPMTMVFAVKDRAQLEGLKAGDKVQFRAEKIGGTYTVTEISVAR